MQISENEAERLAVLYSYGVLDTDFEERYDRLTRIAAKLLDTPIALISLVDKDRQWFKAAFGLETRETPRDVSFCAHAIHNTDVFVVPNAKKDSRFARNPLVTGDMNIRFYAGAPLIGRKGQAMGTFCVIDNKPHTSFNAAQQETLRDLADTVVDMFEMRKSLSKSATLKREVKALAAQLTKLTK